MGVVTQVLLRLNFNNYGFNQLIEPVASITLQVLTHRADWNAQAARQLCRFIAARLIQLPLGEADR